MAIDTAEKRRSVGGNMPTPDGGISRFDRRQVAGNYRGMPIAIALGGTLAPTGAVSRALTAYRGFGGTLTMTGAVARALTAYRSFGGTLTPTGDLAAIVTFVLALGGELGLSGELKVANPLWLMIDATLNWQGEWDATHSYDIDDAVLHKFGEEWHVFISKIGHNVGNVPTSSAEAWRRLFQEPLS